MKKEKKFDCVRMKDEIHEQRRRKIEADLILGPIYKERRTATRV